MVNFVEREERVPKEGDQDHEGPIFGHVAYPRNPELTGIPSGKPPGLVLTEEVA